MYLPRPPVGLLLLCASPLFPPSSDTADTFWDSAESKDAFSPIETVICSRLYVQQSLPLFLLLLLLLFVPLFFFFPSEACPTWNILIENRYPRISVWYIVSLPPFPPHAHKQAPHTGHSVLGSKLQTQTRRVREETVKCTSERKLLWGNLGLGNVSVYYKSNNPVF